MVASGSVLHNCIIHELVQTTPATSTRQKQCLYTNLHARYWITSDQAYQIFNSLETIKRTKSINYFFSFSLGFAPLQSCETVFQNRSTRSLLTRE